ncbi:MAG TPA: hypothetical protein VF815_18185 [Myxococcaceae bacterium]
MAEVLQAWREQEKAEYLARTLVANFPRLLVIAPAAAAPWCSRGWKLAARLRGRRMR